MHLLRSLLGALAVAVALVVGACGGDDEPSAPDAGPPDVVPPRAEDLAGYVADLPGEGALVATLDTTEGIITCELFAGGAPITVANFVGLATGKKPWLDPVSGVVQRGVPYYDGLAIHRTVPGFVIQGGDPLGNGSGGPGYRFDIEVSDELRHTTGALSMANAGPEENGSQYFITVSPQPTLDGGYSVFGQCAQLEIVTAIADLGDRNGRPSRPVATTRVTISRGAAP